MSREYFTGPSGQRYPMLTPEEIEAAVAEIRSRHPTFIPHFIPQEPAIMALRDNQIAKLISELRARQWGGAVDYMLNGFGEINTYNNRGDIIGTPVVLYPYADRASEPAP